MPLRIDHCILFVTTFMLSLKIPPIFLALSLGDAIVWATTSRIIWKCGNLISPSKLDRFPVDRTAIRFDITAARPLNFRSADSILTSFGYDIDLTINYTWDASSAHIQRCFIDLLLHEECWRCGDPTISSWLRKFRLCKFQRYCSTRSRKPKKRAGERGKRGTERKHRSGMTPSIKLGT